MDGIGLRWPLLWTLSLTIECVNDSEETSNWGFVWGFHSSASTEITFTFLRAGDEDGFAVNLTKTDHGG